MNRNLMRLLVFSLSLVALLGYGGKAFASWTTVYASDFSSDPSWTTNDPSNLYWDSTSETYHGWMANTNTSYAYYALTPFSLSGTSFVLTYDSIINSCDWSAGLNMGLWSDGLLYPNSAHTVYGIGDQGYAVGFNAQDSAGNGVNPRDWGWQTGVWYSNTYSYDASTALMSMVTSRRDDGTLLFALQDYITFLPADLKYLGVSRLFMEGYNNLAADFNLDNVMLRTQAIPAPGGIILGMIGVALVTAVRKIRGK